MSFTGSTRAGTAVTRDAADSVKRVTLELGGKSPNLVFADCDLEERVTQSVAECMFNTGQSCDAPTRLLVERGCYDQVVEIATRAAKATRVGDPTEEGDHIGPLFDQIQFDRVQTMIQVGIDECAGQSCRSLGITCLNIGRKTVGCVVRDPDGVLFGVEWNNRQDRTEDFLSRDTHIVVHVGEHGGTNVPARLKALRPPQSTGYQVSALIDAYLNHGLYPIKLNLIE